MYYAECATAAATTAKVATVVGSEHFVAAAGVMVIVKFANKNTGAVASLTLNVNSTGAHAIKKIYATSGISNLTNAAEIAANSFIPFIFTGTYWLVAGLDYNTNTQRTLATVAPLMDGTAAVGTSTAVARQDHVHPTDTSRAADNKVVHKTEDETIGGNKTFTGRVVAAGGVLDFPSRSHDQIGVTMYLASASDDCFPVISFESEDGDEVVLRHIAYPEQDTDAASKCYVDEMASGVFEHGGVAGFNGLHISSLCLLDNRGRMSSFTTSGGTGAKTVNTGSDGDIYFPMANISVNVYRGTQINAGASYSNRKFSTRGVVDVRYTSLRGRDLPSNWADIGDPVYLSVGAVAGLGEAEPAVIVHPAPFPEPNQSDPYTYPQVPRDIIISKKMMEEYGMYLIREGEGENPDVYDYPYQTIRRDYDSPNAYGAYIYLGRMVSSYELMLEEVNPIMAYRPQSYTGTLGVEKHYFVNWDVWSAQQIYHELRRIIVGYHPQQ